MVTQSKFIMIDKDTSIRSEHGDLMYVEKEEEEEEKKMTDNNLFNLEYKSGGEDRGADK